MIHVDANPTNCAAQHFGPWAIEPKWLDQAVSAYKAGTLRAQDNPDGQPSQDQQQPPFEIVGDVAVVPITGAMTKRPSSFAATSTLKTRQALRAATGDPRATSILLVIDSPGGTVAGTGELARDIAELNGDTVHGKPVDVHIDDLCASAAYWVASGARRIFANDTALVGSIGVFPLLEDTSGKLEAEGIKVHLINTGPNKGAFDGTGVAIPDHKLAAVQLEIDGLFDVFRNAVVTGRGMSNEQFNKAADGSVFIASQAQTMGLIDSVGSLDSTFLEIQTMNREQFDQFASNNPAAVADLVRRSGGTTAVATPQTATQPSAIAVAKHGISNRNSHKLNAAIAKSKHVANSFAHTVDDRFNARQELNTVVRDAGFDNVEAYARHEFQQHSGLQKRWISEDIYVRARKHQLLSRLHG